MSTGLSFVDDPQMSVREKVKIHQECCVDFWKKMLFHAHQSIEGFRFWDENEKNQDEFIYLPHLKI